MINVNKARVVVLGAGFGGLELSTLLSEAFGDDVDVTLIDKSDAFVFGYSKLDVMFGRTTLDAVRLPYRSFVKPGVRFLQETVTAIDPEARRVTTDGGTYEADFLVVALGADYDIDATPGLAEAATNSIRWPGPSGCAMCCPPSREGKALIGVCGAPYKCPPAPSECALMLHDYLVNRGVREACEISFVLPLGSPVPPSPETSRALVAAFAERNIKFVPGRRVASLDGARKVAMLDDGTEMPFDLFLGVPKHRVPAVVVDERHGRERLDSGQSADAGDQISRRLRGRRRRQHRHAEGRRVRRGRGARRGERLDRQAAERRQGDGIQRLRHLLHRIRRRAHRQGRGGFLLRSEADRNLSRAVGRLARGQGEFRLEPPRPLVWHVRACASQPYRQA